MVSLLDTVRASPCDLHDDCRYWGLTLGQCLARHRRITDYWGRVAQRHIEEAARINDRAQQLLYLAAGMLAGHVIVQLMIGVLS